MSTRERLFDRVEDACHRLAKHPEWSALFDRLGLNLRLKRAALENELMRSLEPLPRHIPALAEFAPEGQRAIEPGKPALSLLYHLLMSPGSPLWLAGISESPSAGRSGGIPTPVEIATIENYIYSTRKLDLAALRAIAGKETLGVVVFAYEYCSTAHTPHGRHADVCFSRTGVSRVGTSAPKYDPYVRGFVPIAAKERDDHRGRGRYLVPTFPARYAAFISVLHKSKNIKDAAALIGDANYIRGDNQRRYWIPLHKLFPGTECLQGMDIDLNLTEFHTNEKLRRFHLKLAELGVPTRWKVPDIDNPPFKITEGLATLNEQGSATYFLTPAVHSRLVRPAEYEDEPLTFTVPTNPDFFFFSSLTLPEQDSKPKSIVHAELRRAPAYTNIRTRVDADGKQIDLNDSANVNEVVKAGGYEALHYEDGTADGYIRAESAALQNENFPFVDAYSLIAPPDFLPHADQRSLTYWTAQKLPRSERKSTWPVPPDVLADQRVPPNLQLDNTTFTANDDAITLVICPTHTSLLQPPIVLPPLPGGAPPSITPPPIAIPVAPAAADAPPPGSPSPTRPSATWPFERYRYSCLPDSASGVMAPGWDVALTKADDGTEHFASFGLGNPFPEDVRLCATLSAFWATAGPDTARTYVPSDNLAWPTILPLTDNEIGAGKARFTGWDGIRGPVRRGMIGGELVYEYPRFSNVDYVRQALLEDGFTHFPLRRVDNGEYERRVLAMNRVYQAVGLNLNLTNPTAADQSALRRAKAIWAVLSFIIVTHDKDRDDPERREAETQAGVSLTGSYMYRFIVGNHAPAKSSSENPKRCHVAITNETLILMDQTSTLIQDAGGKWKSV